MDLQAVSARFSRFAEVECGASPLYRALARGVAGDERVLQIASAASEGQPVPNLLLAAVHYLLLRGERGELRSFYPSVGGTGPVEKAYPAFADFVRAHENAIRELLRSRRVQTNEVARCAALLPAALMVAREVGGRPLALVEVGTSAGLLLLFDRYGYSYGNGLEAGDGRSKVRVECEVRGDVPPPVNGDVPQIARRIGIDLAPIDVRDDDAALWLRALVWPDEPERAQRLMRAIEVARREPPELRAGDGAGLAGDALGELPADVTPVVVHAHTMNQFSAEARETLDRVLREASRGRVLYRIGMEGGMMDAECRLTIYCDGQAESRVEATYQAHGRWVRWR